MVDQRFATTTQSITRHKFTRKALNPPSSLGFLVHLGTSLQPSFEMLTGQLMQTCRLECNSDVNVVGVSICLLCRLEFCIARLLIKCFRFACSVCFKYDICICEVRVLARVCRRYSDAGLISLAGSLLFCLTGYANLTSMQFRGFAVFSVSYK